MPPPYAILLPGDPAPWFRQRCTTPQGSYTFDMSAGRHVLLYFFASGCDRATLADLELIGTELASFGSEEVRFFGVSADPQDEASGRLTDAMPATRFFWDFDGAVGRLFGALPLDAASGLPSRPRWVLLDPMLRVLGVIEQGRGAAAKVVAALHRLAPRAAPESYGFAPVLSLDGIFEPEFCQRLIAYYQASGSIASGILTESGSGRSMAVSDSGFKRRRDCTLRDVALVEQVQARITRRIVPEIRKVFQFEASHLDRLIIACYDSAERGCFGPHRDNTLRATAHRRFAVSVNLNEDFEGGEIGFPEFGPRLYRPSAGGALIFSCSLMHAVSSVSRGRRYACLPFVYDEEAAQLKRANGAIPSGPAPFS